jgi:hypothetical protein
MRKEGRFSWETKLVEQKKGNYHLVLENPGGLDVVNVVALIPKKKFDEAERLANTFIEHFGTGGIKEAKLHKVLFEKISPVRYKITAPENANWIVFTDSYHNQWKLKQGDLLHNSLPIYSMVNGFYIEPNWTKTEIVFEGQKQVRWGIYYSIVSALILVIFYLWKNDRVINSS